MPAFNLLDAVKSIGQLDPFVLIAWPLLFVLVLTLGWRAHRQSRLDAEREDRDADARAAWFVAQQALPQHVHQALKGGHRGAR